MNRNPVTTLGQILILIGLSFAFVSSAQAQIFSGYGSGSDDDYGEACRIAGDDHDPCSGTLTLGDCNCKQEEPGQDYYWSCSVKWTCTISSESDTERSDDDTDDS